MGEELAYDAASRFTLGGLRILITGSAHGLGLGIASAFVGAGAAVGLLDRDAAALEAARIELGSRGTVYARTADVRDTAAVDSAVTALAAELGGLDVIVNNSGIFPPGRSDEMDAVQVLEVLDINVVGYTRVYKAAAPLLRASGRGVVINMASHVILSGGPPLLSAYVASKGAVLGYTRALAREVGRDGIRVNAIAPGAIPTRGERQMDQSTLGSLDQLDRRILSRQAVQRRASISDVATAALFLASDAGSFVTGQMLVVDGGWTLH